MRLDDLNMAACQEVRVNYSIVCYKQADASAVRKLNIGFFTFTIHSPSVLILSRPPLPFTFFAAHGAHTLNPESNLCWKRRRNYSFFLIYPPLFLHPAPVLLDLLAWLFFLSPEFFMTLTLLCIYEHEQLRIPHCVPEISWPYKKRRLLLRLVPLSKGKHHFHCTFTHLHPKTSDWLLL